MTSMGKSLRLLFSLSPLSSDLAVARRVQKPSVQIEQAPLHVQLSCARSGESQGGGGGSGLRRDTGMRQAISTKQRGHQSSKERVATPAMRRDATHRTHMEPNRITTSIAGALPDFTVTAFANELAGAEQRFEMMAPFLIRKVGAAGRADLHAPGLEGSTSLGTCSYSRSGYKLFDAYIGVCNFLIPVHVCNRNSRCNQDKHQNNKS